MLILHSILRGDHGIATRHFALPEIGRVFDLTPDELNHALPRRGARSWPARALTAALEEGRTAARATSTRSSSAPARATSARD